MKEADEKKFNLSVKGNIRDLLAFRSLLSNRKKIIAKGSKKPITSDAVFDLSINLHPIKQHLIVKEVRTETKSTKTFKLKPDPELGTNSLAFFRAGQYLSLKVKINGVSITRPYSISSSPSDALLGFYEITIKKEENGFLSEYIWEYWEVGTKIESSGPEGQFYYEPLRDSKYIIGIAGGSGITPFRSMAKDISEGSTNANLTILYGSNEEDDIIFYEELKILQQREPDKIKIINVLSCKEVNLEGCEQGFITADLIKKYCNIDRSSFFICGPQIMYDFVENEIKALNIPLKRIRREVYGESKNILDVPGFPKKFAEKSFKIKVQMGHLTKEIPALAIESTLIALERAGLNPPSKCRSGECGFCRSVLNTGEVFINPKSDGRRAADKLLGFFHPCSSYPISDIEIEVPRS